MREKYSLEALFYFRSKVILIWNQISNIKIELILNRYINDVEATEEVFDKHGYFTTGDIARREGDHYFIVGRASVDGELARYILVLNTWQNLEQS